MDVSVIIPALNAAGTIEEQLRALSAQHFDGSFEVLVVDNGSTDDTVGIVKAYSAIDDRVRLLDGSTEMRSGGAARNLGVRHATSEMLAFCDADDVVQPGWLSAIFRAIQTESVVTAALECWSLNPHILHLTHRQIIGEHYICGFVGIPGGAFGIHKQAYLAAGGFDPAFVVAEDSEFAIRLARNGCRIVYLPHASVAVRMTSSPSKAFCRGRGLRASVPRIRERHGIPQPGLILATKRVLWCLRYLAITGPCCITPRGRCTWMSRAGETMADVEEIVRRLRARSRR